MTTAYEKTSKKRYRVWATARLLGIGERTLERWIERGKVPKPQKDRVSGFRYYTVIMIQKINRNLL